MKKLSRERFGARQADNLGCQVPSLKPREARRDGAQLQEVLDGHVFNTLIPPMDSHEPALSYAKT
jgi:hypothetical protein